MASKKYNLSANVKVGNSYTAEFRIQDSGVRSQKQIYQAIRNRGYTKEVRTSLQDAARTAGSVTTYADSKNLKPTGVGFVCIAAHSIH